TPYDINQML
nr:Chain C, PEPTIDE TPYDINQML [Human immunodeficiency virus 2]